MSLLDDAKRMSEHKGFGAARGCVFCGRRLQHADDCLWPSMPRIVVALEAAQAVVDMRFAAWCAHANTITDLADAMQDGEV